MTTTGSPNSSSHDQKDRKDRAKQIGRKLAEAYPDAECALNHRNPFELLVATILSAQCTDERVNQVSPALFQRCPTPNALAAIEPPELEEIIRSTGFFKSKAKNLQAMAQSLADHHNGNVPNDLDSLTALPGVGRKTAHVVLGTAFGIPTGVVVDTHVKRLSKRLELTDSDDPDKIEHDLAALFPKSHWIALGHRLIWHGRAICKARKPNCPDCVLQEICPKIGVEQPGQSSGSSASNEPKRRSARKNP